MSFPSISVGDVSDNVKRLQSYLNKIGAILNIDGDYGPATQFSVAYAQELAGLEGNGKVDSNLWEWLGIQAVPYEKLDTDGIGIIARFEISSLKEYFRKHTWPHLPPGKSSGVTVGIGFDLAQHSKHQFLTAWEPRLPPKHIKHLSKYIGKERKHWGTKNGVKRLRKKGVKVPYSMAWDVFTLIELPRYFNITKIVYPSLETLPSICRTALVSLVYNRGPRLKNKNGYISRTEMKEIQSILKRASEASLSRNQRAEILDEVAVQLIKMKDLWDPSSGLVSRRQEEAELWREGLLDWQSNL